MAKQTASQTVEPVKQPRGPSSLLQTEEGIRNYHLSQFLNNLGIFSTEDLERNYPIKPFQRFYSQQSNVFARINRVEEEINETCNTIDEPSDFAIKRNSKHITNLLGWYTDVSVILKDKENKTVIIIKNFVCIDNGEPELMLFLAPVAKNLPKEEQKIVPQKSSLNNSAQISFSLTSKVLAERCSQLTKTKMKE
ncbi:2679_t:CDS:2 [Cetraspora pellucida]|uniref:2679_t:CDS:1 n=1 Tax=Cetraspora pellucida TaxID=1433469 RepID=A0A9N9NTL5_9GLOM|nr:2679_t:CDS:2 [Cetraspora pellucida]